jgi:hypothetical protein
MPVSKAAFGWPIQGRHSNDIPLRPLAVARSAGAHVATTRCDSARRSAWQLTSTGWKEKPN